MARTPSNMMPLGTNAPDFSLIDTLTNEIKSLDSVKSDKGTLIMFICNHCPFVIHLHEGLKKLIDDYLPTGLSILAISSNDVENYPQDAPDKMKALFEEKGFNIPYLYDETQEVAKAYDAACTPDFYLFDQDLKCVYRGQFDDARPGNDIEVTGKDIRAAIDALLLGKKIIKDQKPSLGCNIKWK